MTQRGQLFVFEGPEGAGKSTQLRMLADWLAVAGIETACLREPGGTVLGDAIRSLVLDGDHPISARAEALLFMASRAELVENRIDPLLAGGVVVLMDRFFLSTYAYQIAGRGLPEEHVRAANLLATRHVIPDLTLVIELSAGDGMARVAARGAHDRMERSGDDFHSRVEQAFAAFTSDEWQRSHPECGRVVGVDGRGSAEVVHTRVVAAIVKYFVKPPPAGKSDAAS